ncbi:MAG: YgiQ family radical SAM protein [Clostridia bacterium]|nr:YgiQ family radical SAM protein [Clostridia bacterium]
METAKYPLPMTKRELEERGIGRPDFILVSGDAYIDHPSFGTAIIGRILERAGFSVAVIAQPNWKSLDDFTALGEPRLGFLVNAGNVDSMVANYTVAKRKRDYDYYSPGGKAGRRPDRAVIVYCQKIREAYGDIPIVIGGIEASLRRFAHYDYWQGKIRRSILVDSGADLLSYGMGERSLLRIAELLDRGIPVRKIRDVAGTVIFAESEYKPKGAYIALPSYHKVAADKEKYAASFKMQYQNCDAVGGKILVEAYDEGILVQNPPSAPLTTKELDDLASIPYTRKAHPIYGKDGIPALEEVEFSITHNRGCFGGCAFCAIAYHQGRAVTSRSMESVLEEVEYLTTLPDFKGYIHDIGGPTANFRQGPCKAVAEGKKGVCANRRCLTPTPCPNLLVDHSEYIELLRRAAAVKGVKKVFVRSGIRHDYVMADKAHGGRFIEALAKRHVSGQLRAAPEHICPEVLHFMGKPSYEVYQRFVERFDAASKKAGLEQYVVPYLMSSHPGSTMQSAEKMARYMQQHKLKSDQVQDFYPTPGTAATVMYWSGLDPFTGKKVYVATSPEEKKAQRALLGKPAMAMKKKSVPVKPRRKGANAKRKRK